MANECTIPISLSGTVQNVDCKIIAEAVNKADAIQLAAELGRLDIVSILLACFGILLAIFAVGGFWLIRGAAINAAKNEARLIAREEAQSIAKEEAKRYMEQNAASLFGEGEELSKNRSTHPNLNNVENNSKSIIKDATEIKEKGDD
jgi:hypothetical protein